MTATVVQDGETLVSGARLLAGEPMIPYGYLATLGNFMLLTLDGDLPDWRMFGQSQTLIYLPESETEVDQISVGDLIGADPIEYLLDEHGFYLTDDAGGLLTND